MTTTTPDPHTADLVLVATLTPNRPIAPCARYDHQTGRTDFVHTTGPCPDNQAPR